MSRVLGLIGLSLASDTARALKAAGEAHDRLDAAYLRITALKPALDTARAERDDLTKRLAHARSSLDVAISERGATEATNRELRDRINAAKACATAKMANVGFKMLRALDGKDVATVTRALREHVAEKAA